MTTSAASCAPSTKTTAFLINLSVCGMAQTGKKGSVAGEPSKGGPSPRRGSGWFILSRVQPKGGQSQASRHCKGHWMTLRPGLERREGCSETLESSARTDVGDHLISTRKSYLLHTRHPES